MISHTVYRGRNNAIVLQLLSDGAPLAAPASIDSVQLAVVDRTEKVDTVNANVVYDNADGTLTAKLGRVPDFAALPDGVYEVEVTGFAASDNFGLAFGSLLIYVRDWAGENPDAS